MWSARLLRFELAAHIGQRIFLQGNPRIAALLGAVMHQPLFANIKVARSRTAPPLIRTPQRYVVLERIHSCETALLQILHLVINALLFFIQRLNLPRAVMNNSNRRAE